MSTLHVVPISGAAAPPAPPAAITLYGVHEKLMALVETADLVPPEQQAEFQAELTQTRAQAVAKIDGVSQFLALVESQAELAGEEIARLQKRKAVYERASRRVKALITRVIQTIGKDAKGKWPKLEGATATLTLRGCVQAVEVTDEAAVPSKFKRATVTLPAELWEQMIDSLDLELAAQVIEAVRAPKLEVSSSSVKKAIDAGEKVPGAKLTGGVYVVRS